MRILETMARMRPLVEHVRVGKRKDFGERMCDAHKRTAQKAYENFEKKGWRDGHDLEDWLEAEQELFLPLQAEVTESEFSFLVQAKVEGFRGADIEIHAEPRKIFVLGKKIAKGSPWKSERIEGSAGAAEIYRVIDLPADVNPAMVTAHIKSGVLEIFLLKAGNARWPEGALRAA